MEDIEIKYHNHIKELNKINTVEYCLINRAMKKYRIQNWILDIYRNHIVTVIGGNIYLSFVKEPLILRKWTQDMYVAKKD